MFEAYTKGKSVNDRAISQLAKHGVLVKSRENITLKADKDGNVLSITQTTQGKTEVSAVDSGVFSKGEREHHDTFKLIVRTLAACGLTPEMQFAEDIDALNAHAQAGRDRASKGKVAVAA